MNGPLPWIRCPEPVAAARARLFCFPYAGAGMSAFGGWPTALRPDIEVHLVQAPGREDRFRERPFTRMGQLMAPLLDAIEPHLDRPFAFLGHSMGGLVAFELTRALRARGHVLPFRLCVSARRAPQLPDRMPPLRHLADGSFVEQIRLRYAGIPHQVLESSELRALLLPMLRADMELLETYEYHAQPPLACAISVFHGRDDQTVLREEVEQWRHQTVAAFSVREMPGDHFFLKSAKAPFMKAVAEDLGADLQAGAHAAPSADAAGCGFGSP
jgi:medium-chain acyl-[acyl-carrier-protein] hydrolase